jgi:hypothetical protein
MLAQKGWKQIYIQLATERSSNVVKITKEYLYRLLSFIAYKDSFVATERYQISLRKGDRLVILEKKFNEHTKTWAPFWEGMYLGRIGFFPIDCVALPSALRVRCAYLASAATSSSSTTKSL